MAYLVREQLLHLALEKLMDRTYSLKVHLFSAMRSPSHDFSLGHSIVKHLVRFCRELNCESPRREMASLWWKMDEIHSKQNSPVYPGPPVTMHFISCYKKKKYRVVYWFVAAVVPNRSTINSSVYDRKRFVSGDRIQSPGYNLIRHLVFEIYDHICQFVDFHFHYSPLGNGQSSISCLVPPTGRACPGMQKSVSCFQRSTKYKLLIVWSMHIYFYDTLKCLHWNLKRGGSYG